MRLGTKLILALLVAGFAAVYAQPGPPADAPRWGRERIETVIIGKFSTELQLTPEQAERFFPRFQQFQNETETLQRQQHERRMELDRMSQDPNANPERVNSLIAEQSSYEQRISGLKRMFLTDVSAFLTPQQVSRCAVLLDELPRKVREMIDERRDHRRSKTGGGGKGQRGY